MSELEFVAPTSSHRQIDCRRRKVSSMSCMVVGRSAAFILLFCLGLGTSAGAGVIDGRVIKDTNGDGMLSSGEPFLRHPSLSCAGEPLAGLTVSWSGPSSGNTSVGLCNSGGPYYHIEGLSAGTYQLTISVPSGWQSTAPTSLNVVVTSTGTSQTSFFMRPVVTGAIDGRVIKDTNGDGQLSVGEIFLRDPSLSCAGEALAGLTVSWSGPSSGNTSVSLCNSGGPFYHIEGLTAGTYQLTISVPSGWQATAPTSLNVVVTSTGTSQTSFFLRPVAAGAIDGRVVKDTNGDGQLSVGEIFLRDSSIACAGEALAGMTVSWTGPSSGGTLVNLCNDGGPYHHIANLIAGTYTLKVSVPSGWLATAATSLNVPVSASNTSQTSFFLRPVNNGTIDGRVIKDINGNGVVDPGDVFLRTAGFTCSGEALAGLTVAWSGPSSGSTSVNLCNADGPYYHVPNLASGTYALSISGMPPGWRVSRINVAPVTSGGIAQSSIFLAPAAASPTISGTSPSPIVGSSDVQPLTVLGSGFVKDGSVTVAWTGGSKRLTPAEVTYVNAGKLTLWLRTSKKPDTWRVTVTNPDGQVSNTQQVLVVAPETITACGTSTTLPSLPR